MALCKDCEEFLKVLHQEVPAMGFARPLEVVEAAAEAGCRACAIYAAIYHHFVEAGFIPKGSVVPVFISAVAFFSRPSMLAGIPDYEGPCMTFLLRPAEEVESLLRSSSVEGDATNSDASFACAKEWLRICTTSHTSCRPFQQDGSYRPTRLLHISPSGTEVRLCEGDDEMPSKLIYATLSHSWGSVLPLTLIKDRMSSFKRGIPLTDLPKTFQEAVQVSQRFGIDYIWIDCLCIIQDSADDWKQESVLMASIYGNSHLNIAATASRDGRGGCFRPRRATALRPVKMTLHQNDYYLVDAEMWWEAFEQAPLNTRAWVLQERLLSPRVLHFDHDQLVWECNELTASERYPDGISGLIPSPRFLRNRLDLLLQTPGALLPGQELFYAWKPIVRAYSSCGLTKSFDKLIALHGIASRIQEALKANYGAGLFSTNLESQLLWRVLDNETSTRPEQHVAPSWSWASIIGPVSVLPQWDFLDTRGEEYTRQFKPAELREKVFCRVRNKELFGTRDATSVVSREKLEVEGYLVPMRYVALSETANWKGTRYGPRLEYEQDPDTLPTEVWPMEMRSWRWSMDEGNSWDVVAYDGGSDHGVLITTKRGDETNSFNLWFEYDVRAEALAEEQRWLLPVYSVTEWKAVDVFDMKRYRALHGLLLERVGNEGAVFRRCGTFTLKASLNEDAPWRLWNSALRFDALEGIEPEICDDVVVPVLPAEHPSEDASDEERSIRYEQRDGARQYVVTIL
ncbi:heterokaryon incompatibility protein-domain-containing protein [Cladorrhinum sp. PSN332]|nr:heterokaryon incompatibility protein-domain-containing protein [Cladorrhinum sp. PSN332]